MNWASALFKKCFKVLAKKGKRLVDSVTSMEHSQTVTIICCNNAAGTFVPSRDLGSSFLEYK